MNIGKLAMDCATEIFPRHSGSPSECWVKGLNTRRDDAADKIHRLLEKLISSKAAEAPGGQDGA